MIDNLEMNSQEISRINTNLKENLTIMLQKISFIQDFWIFRVNGTRIFSYVRDPLIKKSMFGMYLSAFNGIVKEMGHGGLKSFKIRDKLFTIFAKDGYLFVASSIADNKEKKIQKYMNDFSNLFFSSELHGLDL